MKKNFEIKNIEIAPKRLHFQNLLFFSRGKEHEKKNVKLKILKLHLKDYIFRTYYFLVEVTFNVGNTKLCYC